MTTSRLQSLAWLVAVAASTAWIFRGFLRPGIPVLLDHPVHYAEFLYATGTLIPQTGWPSGWCDLHLAGFPMLVTYSLFGILPGVILRCCLGVGPETAYKCCVFLSVYFAAAMLFVFLRRRIAPNAAGVATLLWLFSPLVIAPCACGLWHQFWGIGFLLGVFALCNETKKSREIPLLTVLLLLTAVSHVYSAMALGLFLLLWLTVSRGHGYHDPIAVLTAGLAALLVGAVYFGPFLESFRWFAPKAPMAPPIPFTVLGGKIIHSLVSGNWALIFLGLGGVAVAARKSWRGKDKPFHAVMFLFLLFSLILSLAPWHYVPGVKEWNIPANLQAHGTRSLLYAQIALAYFACFFLSRAMGFSRVLSIPFLLFVVLGLARPSPFFTMADLKERQAIAEAWNWIGQNAPAHRGLVQSTLGNMPGLLGQSHVMALQAFQTGKPQVGGWIGGTLYPHERQFLTESGMLFGKDIAQVSNLELLRNFQAFDLTWAVACESRLKQKLEGSGFFEKKFAAGPFNIYMLRGIFYNPAQWRADPPAVSVEKGISRAGRMDWKITTDRDHAKLVLKHTAHPFWQARLDGEPVPINQDDLVRMNVEIPRAGRHVLSLRFVHPKPMWMWLSAVSAAILAGAWFFYRWKRACQGAAAAVVLLCSILGPASVASGQTNGYLYYTVRGGDTLQSISRLYRVSWRTIAQLNRVRRPYRLSDGQILKIPKTKFRIVSQPATSSPDTATAEVIPSTFFPDPLLVAKIKSLLAINAPEMLHWRYIVIHHSATPNGNARGFDAFHRYRRHMAHGLAYHFVIDNGYGGGNGLIEVGPRWKEQWPGGHTANRLMNEIGIGICLVGNFEKSQPSKQQMDSLVVLAKLLQEMCNIPDRNVILHRHVAQRGTLCPGRKFPWEKLRRMLLGIQLPPGSGQ